MNLLTIIIPLLVFIIYILGVKLIFPTHSVLIATVKNLSVLDLLSVFTGKSSKNRIHELRMALFIIATLAMIVLESLITIIYYK